MISSFKILHYASRQHRHNLKDQENATKAAAMYGWFGEILPPTGRLEGEIQYMASGRSTCSRVAASPLHSHSR